MSVTDQYPNNHEVREWAMSKRPDMVTAQGRLPRFVIIAWNRAHPDRPYVQTQAYHGTKSGYSARRCRCARCVETWAEYQRLLYASRKSDRDHDLADELAP